MTSKTSQLKVGKTLTLREVGDLNLRIRGRLGNLIYQGTNAQFVNAGTPSDPNRMVRSQATGTNPGTPDQLIQQGHIRAGNLMWQGFSTAEKDRFNTRRSSVVITNYHGDRVLAGNGYRLWIHVYYRVILTGGNIDQWLLEHPVKPRRPKKRW